MVEIDDIHVREKCGTRNPVCLNMLYVVVIFRVINNALISVIVLHVIS